MVEDALPEARDGEEAEHALLVGLHSLPHGLQET